MELKRERAKVIMLPTDNKSILYKLNTNNSLHIGDYDISEGFRRTNQHLYFTTDEEIKEGWCIIDNECVYFNGEYGEEVKRSKIIATMDVELGIGDEVGGWYPLPQPSKAFIEKYRKEGGIDEVDVEYNIIHADRAPGGFEAFIKIDSHNTITIHPIKNSWSREEVENLLYDALTTDGRGAFNVAWESEDADKYIKDNL